MFFLDMLLRLLAGKVWHLDVPKSHLKPQQKQWQCSKLLAQLHCNELLIVHVFAPLHHFIFVP